MWSHWASAHFENSTEAQTRCQFLGCRQTPRHGVPWQSPTPKSAGCHGRGLAISHVPMAPLPSNVMSQCSPFQPPGLPNPKPSRTSLRQFQGFPGRRRKFWVLESWKTRWAQGLGQLRWQLDSGRGRSTLSQSGLRVMSSQVGEEWQPGFRCAKC